VRVDLVLVKKRRLHGVRDLERAGKRGESMMHTDLCREFQSEGSTLRVAYDRLSRFVVVL